MDINEKNLEKTVLDGLYLIGAMDGDASMRLYC